MNRRDAVALIKGAVPRHRGTWADVGAGDGTFTRALAHLLQPGSRIYAIDRNARALAALGHWAENVTSDVVSVQADFTRNVDLPGMRDAGLDGMLLANALHFVRDAERVLARLATLVRTGGRIVIVEYDGRRASPWIPYPITSARLPALAAAAGLSPPVVTATHPSQFGGSLYAAAADRLAS